MPRRVCASSAASARRVSSETVIACSQANVTYVPIGLPSLCALSSFSTLTTVRDRPFSRSAPPAASTAKSVHFALIAPPSAVSKRRLYSGWEKYAAFAV